VRTEVNEVRDAFPEAVTAVDWHLASAAIGSLDLPQRHVDGQASALQHLHGLGQRLEHLVTPVARWRQPARGVDRAIGIEVLGEKRPRPELVARLEASDELAPEHGTAAVQVESPIPLRQGAAGRAEIDGDGLDGYLGLAAAALDQRRSEQLAGQPAIVKRHRRQLVEGELSVGAGRSGRARIGEKTSVHACAQADRRALRPERR